LTQPKQVTQINPEIFKIVIIAEIQSTEITSYVRKIQVIINDISQLLLLSRRGVLFKSSVRDFQAQESRDTDIKDSNENKESDSSHEDACSTGSVNKVRQGNNETN
jgi:hypothetical protein